MPVIAAIALGANATSSVGVPEKTLAEALAMLVSGGHQLVAVSRFFRTPAFPPGMGDDYVNAAALIRTERAPAEVLKELHATEARLGRVRAERWGARTIDLDLVFAGDAVLPDADTVREWIGLPPQRQRRDVPDGILLPHPRLAERAFVLVPLAEIVPRWRHPLTGLSVAEMRAALPDADAAAIRPI